MSKSQENYRTHTILQPKDCKCDGGRHCNICDGGLAFCTVCKGGEIELEEQTCEERCRCERIAVGLLEDVLEDGLKTNMASWRKQAEHVVAEAKKHA